MGTTALDPSADKDRRRYAPGALGTPRRHRPRPRLVQCASDQVTWLQTCGQPDLRQGYRFIPKTLRVSKTLRVWSSASCSALYTRPRRFDTAQMFGYNTYLFRTVVLRPTTSPPCAEWANATQRQESTRNYRIPLLLFHTNTLAATGRYLPLLGTHIPKRRARPPGQGLGRALCVHPHHTRNVIASERRLRAKQSPPWSKEIPFL